MHWRLKGLTQKALGLLPGGAFLHHQLQRRLGGLRSFPREFAMKIDDWESMTEQLRGVGMPIAGKRFFEIGTGWYPTFPFACYLGGAQRVTTVDLNPHLRPDLVLACVDALGNELERIAKHAQQPLDEVRIRYARMHAHIGAGDDLGAATDGVVRYRAPADATRSGLDAHEIDAVFSNSVLEHVPRAAIDAMYIEARRILAPGGVMFHSVNCGDHYAYVDRRINQLNYLQFSDRQWAVWNNAFLYQNRIRAHEFVDAAVAAGFEIVHDASTVRSERLEQLARMHVHPQFAQIPRERLCLTTIDFIGRAPQTEPASH
jgi:SAM-dependent methyltransferase